MEARDAATKAELAGNLSADAAANAAAAAAAAEDAATRPDAGLPSSEPMATSLEPDVTVVSAPADSIVGDYTVDFDRMDSNHDGAISSTEAASNSTLTAEFRAVDNNHDGKLSRKELEGWKR
ncbi:hypothetical protein INQ40_10380 [Lysobacter sp. H21R4]|nr:hypothetical protein INQ40_10380 [Lysobacter sp. H21R4]